MKRILAILALATLASSCASAAQVDKASTTPRIEQGGLIIVLPNGGEVMTSCDGRGNRVYSRWQADSGVDVVADPTCPGAAR
jgi:opacity protein-like surface antigen